MHSLLTEDPLFLRKRLSESQIQMPLNHGPFSRLIPRLLWTNNSAKRLSSSIAVLPVYGRRITFTIQTCAREYTMVINRFQGAVLLGSLLLRSAQC